jgi:hypothetical protein
MRGGPGRSARLGLAWGLMMAAALAVLPGVGAAAAVPRFSYTHSVDVSITITDLWTRNVQFGCAPGGSGEVKITLHWRRPARAHPEINAAGGRWTLLVPGPGGHSVLDLPPQPQTGTITYTDNEQLTGDDPTCTGTLDKSACHSYPLGGKANVFGIDRRRLQVASTFVVAAQIKDLNTCRFGDFNSMNSLDFFKSPLTIRMPAPSVLRHRRTVVLRGSDTGHITDLPDPFFFDASIDETVIQSAVVTFKRLRG